METYFNTDAKLQRAQKKVKAIKGFYIHATVYALVNLFIIISNSVVEGNGFSDMESYDSAIFWGFGLLAHGLFVFGSPLFLGRNWEERKINEIMSK